MAEDATCALDPNEMMGSCTLGYWQLTGGGALSTTRAQIMADGIGVPMYRQSNPRIHDVVGMGLLALIRLGR
jgi:sugar (pentulose or hexulose) kinase